MQNNNDTPTTNPSTGSGTSGCLTVNNDELPPGVVLPSRNQTMSVGMSAQTASQPPGAEASFRGYSPADAEQHFFQGQESDRRMNSDRLVAAPAMKQNYLYDEKKVDEEEEDTPVDDESSGDLKPSGKESDKTAVWYKTRCFVLVLVAAILLVVVGGVVGAVVALQGGGGGGGSSQPGPALSPTTPTSPAAPTTGVNIPPGIGNNGLTAQETCDSFRSTQDFKEASLTCWAAECSNNEENLPCYFDTCEAECVAMLGGSPADCQDACQCTTGCFTGDPGIEESMSCMDDCVCEELSLPAGTSRGGVRCGNPAVAFSQQFGSNAVLHDSQCNAWNVFRESIPKTGTTFLKLTIKGSLDPVGVSCDIPEYATALCQGLANGTQDVVRFCSGRLWTVDASCSGSGGLHGLELSASGACSCTDETGYTVSPCLREFGAVGHNSTCTLQAQTLEVVCEMAPEPTNAPSARAGVSAVSPTPSPTKSLGMTNPPTPLPVLATTIPPTPTFGTGPPTLAP